jgi:hypothetical protein
MAITCTATYPAIGATSIDAAPNLSQTAARTKLLTMGSVGFCKTADICLVSKKHGKEYLSSRCGR